MDGVPRILIVGGGYAGVEALAELQDMALDASARYPGLSHLPKGSFDLHVLGMPPALVLSQDQTLKFESRSSAARSEDRRPLTTELQGADYLHCQT